MTIAEYYNFNFFFFTTCQLTRSFTECVISGGRKYRFIEITVKFNRLIVPTDVCRLIELNKKTKKKVGIYKFIWINRNWNFGIWTGPCVLNQPNSKSKKNSKNKFLFIHFLKYNLACIMIVNLSWEKCSFSLFKAKFLFNWFYQFFEYTSVQIGYFISKETSRVNNLS